jgi:hypothetical protein
VPRFPLLNPANNRNICTATNCPLARCVPFAISVLSLPKRAPSMAMTTGGLCYCRASIDQQSDGIDTERDL